MTAIIVSGHGQFSLGLLDAFEMIFGKDEEIVAVPFLKGEGIPQLKEKFHKEIAKFQEQEILILVDVFGGTPYNAATQFIYGNKNIDVVTGVNLPLLLEGAGLKSQPLKELIQSLRGVSQESFKVFSEQIEKLQLASEDKEEDEL